MIKMEKSICVLIGLITIFQMRTTHCVPRAVAYPLTQEQLAQYVAAQQTLTQQQRPRYVTQQQPTSVPSGDGRRQYTLAGDSTSLFTAAQAASDGAVSSYEGIQEDPSGASAALLYYQPRARAQTQEQPQEVLVAARQPQYRPIQNAYQPIPKKYKLRPTIGEKQQGLLPAEEYDPNPQYQFSFDIKDDESTNYHNRKETRDGDKISGSYSVVDSDGYIRTVTYTADPKEGFKADVSRQPTDIVVKLPKHPTPSLGLAQQYQQLPPTLPASQAALLAARKQQTKQYLEASSLLEGVQQPTYNIRPQTVRQPQLYAIRPQQVVQSAAVAASQEDVEQVPIKTAVPQGATAYFVPHRLASPGSPIPAISPKAPKSYTPGPQNVTPVTHLLYRAAAYQQ